MIYCIDIDGTICATEGNNYSSSVPYTAAIDEINRLYNNGHYIKFFTARGTTSGIDWTELTTRQLESWGVKYHELIMNIKPSFDILIDDRAIPADIWREKLNPKIGFLAGAFDIIHPGYILMFKDAKTVCDHLVVALQTDPTVDRPEKNKPVQSYLGRKSILESIRYVDEVVTYTTEKELYQLMENMKIDIRILGSDYENKKINGHDLDIPIYFHKREHEWSATNLRNKIKESSR